MHGKPAPPRPRTLANLISSNGSSELSKRFVYGDFERTNIRKGHFMSIGFPEEYT